MIKTFNIIFCLIALNVAGQDFQTQKTKTIDSINLVYASAIKKAQKEFENSLLKADENMQKALAELEKKELEWLNSVAVKPEEIKIKQKK